MAADDVHHAGTLPRSAYDPPMRLVALVIATLSLLGLPAVASGDSFEHLTAYAGIYDFSQDEVAQPGLPDGLHSAQQYVWATFDYNHVMVRDDGTYTSRHTRFISAHGHVKIAQIQGSALTGWAVHHETTDCTIKSALTPVVTRARSPRGADPDQPGPVDQRRLGYPRLRLQARQRRSAVHAAGHGRRAAVRDAAEQFVPPWTYTSPGATVFTPLPPTTLMRDAFGGAATIRYHDITGKYGLWRRQFKVPPIKNTATRPGFHGATRPRPRRRRSTRRSRSGAWTTSPSSTRSARCCRSQGFLGAEFQGLPAGQVCRPRQRRSRRADPRARRRHRQREPRRQRVVGPARDGRGQLADRVGVRQGDRAARARCASRCA